MKKSTLADTRFHADETLDDPEQIFLESWILALPLRIRTTSVQFLANAIPSGSKVLSPLLRLYLVSMSLLPCFLI